MKSKKYNADINRGIINVYPSSRLGIRANFIIDFNDFL